MEQNSSAIIDYIKQQMAAGYDAPTIKQALAGAGWPVEHVEAVFAQLSGVQQQPQPQPPVQQPQFQPLASQMQPVAQQPVTQSTVGPISNVPVSTKYGVFRAIGQSIKAIVYNFPAFFVTILISVAVFFLAILAIIPVTAAISSITSKYLSSVSMLVGVVLFAVMYTVIFALATSLIASMMANAVMDGANHQRSNIGQLLSRSVGSIARILTVQIWTILYTIWPLMVVLTAGISIAISAKGDTTPAFMLLVTIGSLIAIVWEIIALFRYILAPMVAIFEPAVAPRQALKRSNFLLTGGGKWFLIKAGLILIVLMIPLSAISGKPVQQLGESNNVVVMVSMVVLNVVANAVGVLLYRNRVQVKG